MMLADRCSNAGLGLCSVCNSFWVVLGAELNPCWDSCVWESVVFWLILLPVIQLSVDISH